MTIDNVQSAKNVLQSILSKQHLRSSLLSFKIKIFYYYPHALVNHQQMNSYLLQTTNEAKFLGLTYDKKLRKRLYLLEMKNVFLLALNILKMLTNKNHEAASKKLRNV